MIDTEKKYIKSKSEDFKFKSIINNVCLDDSVMGFKTVGVQGRDILPIKGKLEEPEGGLSYVRNNKFKSRIIEIEYIIRTKDYRQLMRASEQLNSMLIQNHDVEIYFTDDRFRYFGQVVDITVDDSYIDWVKGIIKIACCDFRKYGETITQKDITIFNYNYSRPIIPTKITLTCKDSVYNIKLINSSTGAYIILNRNFSQNDVIEIYPQLQKIVKGSENLLKYLDIRSNLEDFYISYGERIYANGCKIDIEFSEVAI